MFIITRYILLILLIIVPLAAAQEDNFNNYSSLDIDISISSDIQIDYLKKTSRLEFLEVDLQIFPRNDDRQIIINKKIISNPISEIDDSKNIVYRWDDIKSNILEYGIEATVRVDNDFKKISDKINFPLRSLDENVLIYTDHSEFIDINEEIKDKAAEIVEGETDYYIATYKLADWVKNNVVYNLSTLTADAVQKSTWVFENKQGVCDELTNLFISMTRSVGIPTRFVAGAVYTNVYNDFGNHGWAEVYFPGFGWIPFDVTFGQYGWIDPSHVKFIESLDYGKSRAVFYTWRSRDVKVNPSSLEVKSNIKEKTGSIGNFVNIDIKPAKLTVGFGSFVPVEVIVENVNDFYLPLSLVITKAPKLRGENRVFTVLKPKETKSFYWITEIPDNLNERYIYTTFLEVQNNLNEIYTGKIKYASNYDKYSLKRAERLISSYSELDEKELFSDINIECEMDKEVYYEGEIAAIRCKLTNLGNTNFDILDICLAEGCKSIKLRIAETKIVAFDYNVASSENLKVNVVSENLARTSNVELFAIKIPVVEIIYYGEDKIDYNKKPNVSIEIISNTLIRDVILDVNDKQFKLQDINQYRKLNLNLNPKELSDSIIFKISYKDDLGELYEFEKKQNIKVINVPWYAKIINFLRKIF